MKPSIERSVLALVLLCAVMFRLAYLFEAVHKPDFAFPVIDAEYHDYWARCLASGTWATPHGGADPHIRDRPYFRPPGYPYFLALVYRMLGPSYVGPRLVQMGLGVLNCMLVFLVTRRLFGAPTALIAAALASSYWVFVYYEMEFLEPVLLVSLGLLTMHMLTRLTSRASWLTSLGAGAVVGVFAVVRPNVLLFCPVVLGWMWWLSHRQGGGRWTWAAVLAAFLGGVALTIAPTTIRNYLVGRDFVLISANAGVNLLVGNNPTADGMFSDRNFATRFASCYDYPSVVAHLEKELGRPLKYSGASAHLAKEAARFARTSPAQFLRTTLRKAILFWSPVEMGHNKEEHYERLASPMLRVLPGGFAFVVATSLLGVGMWMADRRKSEGQCASGSSCAHQTEMVALILLFVGTYYLSFVPFFIAGQYRVPVVPFLQMFSAYAICGLARDLMARRLRRFSLCVVAGLSLYAGVSVNWTGYQPSLPKWHFDRGVAYGKVGRLDLAIRELTEATRYTPDSPETHYNLGLALGLKGQLGDARAHFAEAARLNPEYVEAHFNTGIVLARLGLVDDAIRALSQAVALKPDFVEARRQLAVLLVSQKRCSEAISHLETALTFDPRSALLMSDLVQALLACRKSAEAVSRIRQALLLNPGDPAWMNQLAWVEATDPSGGVRDAAEAIRLAQQACSLSHSNVPVFLDTLAAAYAEAGRYEEALRTSEEALRLASRAGDVHLAQEIELRRRLYRAGRPFRSEPHGPTETDVSAGQGDTGAVR